MALQTLLWDSRIRTLALLLPALGILLWIASELASEEFVAPTAVLSLFGVLVVFTVFVKTLRFEAAVLCLLLVGYLVGNRGFADLAVVKPLYPGELGLSIIVGCMLFRFALSRELPDFSGWFARVIFVYCGLGAVRLLLDYEAYRLDAIRDSAMVYYAAFFFFGRQLVTRPESKWMLEKCLAFSFLALVPVAIIERLAPDLLLNGPIGDLLYQKDDLLTTFGAMAVFIIYTRPKMFRWNWVRISLILFYIVLVVSGVGRAALLAMMVGSILMYVANRPRFFLYPAAAALLGLTLLAGFAAAHGSNQASDPAILVEKFESIVDVDSSNNYNSDFGDMKAGTNDFRRKLWATFIDETNATSPWFGRGFGFNFVTDFEDMYHLGEAGQLRSAHNFYVTLYGRMGWIGILVFAVLTVQIIVAAIRAALWVRAGQQPVADLGYWCSIWVILVSSAVGVVLEGPVGAVVFWALLGVSVEVSQQAVQNLHRELASRRLADFPPLPVLPERRSVAYGMARDSATPSR